MEPTCIYPYGDEITSTSNDRGKFATYTRDSYTGLDYADQRFYASPYGRFNTPDPAGARAANPSDPGTLNRYSYAAGDPINRLDPMGLWYQWADVQSPQQSLWNDLGGGRCDSILDSIDGFVDTSVDPCNATDDSGLDTSDSGLDFGFVDCGSALADLISATANLDERIAAIVLNGGNPDPGHVKALQEAANRVSKALAKVSRSCAAAYAGAAAAIAAAGQALEAAAPFLLAAAAVDSGPSSAPPSGPPSLPPAPIGPPVARFPIGRNPRVPRLPLPR